MTDQNLSMAEFVPAKVELQKLSEKAKTVDITNIEEVHSVRIELRDTRVAITKKGKELRDGAVRFQREVIQREKELVAIIEGDEERLQKVEEEAKLRKEMEARREELPSRREALKTVGDDVEVSDNELLAMDNDEFNAYRLRRIEAKLLKDKAEFEEKERLAAEEKRKKEEAELAERKAKLEKEEAEARAKRAEEDRIAAEKRAAEQKVLDEERAKLAAEKAAADAVKVEQERQAAIKQAEAEAAERKAAAEKEAQMIRLREEKFNNWLTASGYNKDTDNVVPKPDGTIQVWRLVATYNPKN